jgi:hypothetical protein
MKKTMKQETRCQVGNNARKGFQRLGSMAIVTACSLMLIGGCMKSRFAPDNSWYMKDMPPLSCGRLIGASNLKKSFDVYRQWYGARYSVDGNQNGYREFPGIKRITSLYMWLREHGYRYEFDPKLLQQIKSAIARNEICKWEFEADGHVAMFKGAKPLAILEKKTGKGD